MSCFTLFLEQGVLNILSLVFRFFLLESQTSVPRAELQEKGKKGRVFFISVRNCKTALLIPHGIILELMSHDLVRK